MFRAQVPLSLGSLNSTRCPMPKVMIAPCRKFTIWVMELNAFESNTMEICLIFVMFFESHLFSSHD